MSSLAKTFHDLSKIMEVIEENEGVIEDSLLPTLQEQEKLVCEKVDAYVNFIECVQGQIEKQKQVEKEINLRRKSLENLEFRLKTNAKILMESYEISELKGTNRKIKLNNSGGKQALLLEEDFDEKMVCVNKKYIRHLPTDIYEKQEVYVIDKDKLRKHLEDGNEIQCVGLLPRGKYVKIV